VRQTQSNRTRRSAARRAAR